MREGVIGVMAAILDLSYVDWVGYQAWVAGGDHPLPHVRWYGWIVREVGLVVTVSPLSSLVGMGDRILLQNGVKNVDMHTASSRMRTHTHTHTRS